MPGLAALLVVASGAVACGECESNTDCALGEVCSAGSCVRAPRPTVELRSDVDVEARFDLVLDVTFDADEATLEVARADDAPGNRCLPFFARTVVIAGNGGGTVSVVVEDLPALGPSFGLDLLLTVPGYVPLASRIDLRGPPAGDDVGGARLSSPAAGAIDAVGSPLVRLAGHVDGRTSAWVEPAQGPATPRLVVAEGAGEIDVPVLGVRGPHTLWTETLVAGTPRRCGIGLVGEPRGDAPDVVELTLVATAPADAWVTLSTQTSTADGVGVCAASDADLGRVGFTSSARCAIRQHADRPGTVVVDSVALSIDDGVIDVAVNPLVAVGPVTAVVRVTRGGRHAGLLGPFTLLPEAGQSWIAGQIVVATGAVQSIASSADVVVGAPW